MMHIFYSPGHTKQRHTERKRCSGDGLCGHLFVHLACLHLKGVGLFQRWTGFDSSMTRTLKGLWAKA